MWLPKGFRKFTTRVHESSIQAMEELSKLTGRPFCVEVEDAFNRHTENPPKVTHSETVVEKTPHPDKDVEDRPEGRRKRRVKRK